MPDYDTSSLAAGVGGGLDRAARSYQNGKIADSIVRVNPEMLQMLGMGKEEFGALSADDKTQQITGAITAMGLKAQQAQAAAQAADVQSQADLRRADVAAKQQGLEEDQAIGEALKRYSAGPPVATNPAGSTPTPDQIDAVLTPNARLNFALGTPGMGGRVVPKFVDALNKLQASGSKPAKGLPVGTQMNLPDGTVITGTGELNEPNIRPPKAAEGLDIGETMTDKDGNLWVGKGKGNPPEIKLAADIKKDKGAGDTGRGRSVFLQSAPELARQLDNLEAAIKKNNGNNPTTTWNAALVAALGQGPFQIAENYNKLVDPHSVNRPEKLRQDMEHLLPMGAGTRMDVTLKAIENLRSEAINRISNFYATEKELPPNLPPSIHNELIGRIPGLKIHPDTKFDTVAEAEAAGAKPGDRVRIRMPDGNYMSGVLK